jgi:sec-independent protein translocase protein TatA
MFDPSAPHIIILLVVVLLLFGSARLPRAARSLGQSMHIFKKSVQGLPDDDTNSAANPPANAMPPVFTPPLPPAVAAPDATQQQLADLQRQVADLQRQSADGTGQSSEAQTTRPI